jgi:hypothetical protein
LRTAEDVVDLKEALSKATLEIAVVSEAGETDFIKGTVDLLESVLRDTFQQLLQEDVVAKAVALIDGTIERFAIMMSSKKGNVGRAARVLGLEGLEEPK